MANCRECYLVWLLVSQLSQQRALDVILFLKFLILLVCSLFIRKCSNVLQLIILECINSTLDGDLN